MAKPSLTEICHDCRLQIGELYGLCKRIWPTSISAVDCQKPSRRDVWRLEIFGSHSQSMALAECQLVAVPTLEVVSGDSRIVITYAGHPILLGRVVVTL